ncbi:uncharacterized protein LOC112214569 isoform X2 [Oncorhynchus tshawytscha]|uniref:uncharacterized protein LOC112214569 isoform X2 n=1 Tax=Oncorhynchus tshawytscha TaxID=74940 RepID=UPI001C3CA847|nr:uncharacterized protein LOC112214569 isoform X2 [Oncorhynchus tshawytscha]
MVKVPKAGRGVPPSNSRASTVWRVIPKLLSSGPKPIRSPAPDGWSQDHPESISPVERLAICLRFLATGDSYRTIGFSFRVGRSTVAGIVPSVAQAIWDCLVGEYMPVPKEEDWRTIVAEILESKGSDGGTLRDSAFGQALQDGTLDIPPPASLPGAEDLGPVLFVGDEAFPLRPNLMRPYAGRQLPLPKPVRIFNKRLSRARLMAKRVSSSSFR